MHKSWYRIILIALNLYSAHSLNARDDITGAPVKSCAVSTAALKAANGRSLIGCLSAYSYHGVLSLDYETRTEKVEHASQFDAARELSYVAAPQTALDDGSSHLLRDIVGALAEGSSGNETGSVLAPISVWTSGGEGDQKNAWLAFDGDPRTAWEGIPAGDSCWMALTYSNPITPAAITFDFTPVSGTNRLILTSTDAVKWIEQTSGDDLMVEQSIHYIWLIFPDGLRGKAVEVGEINVFIKETK